MRRLSEYASSQLDELTQFVTTDVEGPAFLVELARLVADNRNGTAVTAGVETTWTPVDLAPIVTGIRAGDIVGPTPSIMLRSDGIPLLYPGEVAQLAGEPEGCKGWISLQTATVEIQDRKHVLYIDMEDSPASVVSRLLALGAAPEAITEHFTYVRPEEAVTADALQSLLTTRTPTLAIIDGVTEAYALLGLDYTANQDVPVFLRRLVRPIAATGAAVVLIDHVPKDKTNRGRFAIGAQHKLAGIATAYGVEVVTAPSRIQSGLVKLIVSKDRHGHVRGHAHADVIALVRIEPENDGANVTVTFDPPDATDETGRFRPTVLMERVSRHLEQHPGLTGAKIRTNVTGKATGIDTALDVLIAEGHVRVEVDGQARRHHVVKPYRETDQTPDPVPTSRPRPTPVPDGGEVDPVLPSPPEGGRDAGHDLQDTATPSRVPDDPDPDLVGPFDPLAEEAVA